MTSTDPSIADQAETFVRDLAEQLTVPRAGECLCCFVARQIEQFGCDGTHRHALRFRDLTAPRATALLDRLSAVGGCCCDCELFLNGYLLVAELGRRSTYVERDGWEEEIPPPELPLPACAGVRRGSIKPCREWVRLRRW